MNDELIDVNPLILDLEVSGQTTHIVADALELTLGLSLDAFVIPGTTINVLPLFFDLALSANRGAESTILTAEPLRLRISLKQARPAVSGVITVSPISLRFFIQRGQISQYNPTDTNIEIWGSKPGQLSFALDDSNESFRRPSGSRGGVLFMGKVGRRLIVWSAYGIDAMQAEGVVWGLEHLSNHGLLSSWAVTEAEEGEYWFLDTRKKLIQLTSEGFRDHGCAMWFDEPGYVLTYDPLYKIIYISSASKGFAYDTENRSLGIGIPGITGITNNRVIVGQGELKPSLFNICTNAYDFGTRAYKTLRSVEFSADVKHFLEAAIDFRHTNDMDWKTTPWKRVNPTGIAYIPCYGLEFRFRLRSNVAQAVHLDNIRVMGTIHGYDFLNAIGWAPNSGQGA